MRTKRQADPKLAELTTNVGDAIIALFSYYAANGATKPAKKKPRARGKAAVPAKGGGHQPKRNPPTLVHRSTLVDALTIAQIDTGIVPPGRPTHAVMTNVASAISRDWPHLNRRQRQRLRDLCGVPQAKEAVIHAALTGYS